MSRSRDVAKLGGLIQVIPSSIVVGSGTGTVNPNGAINFSGSTSISINNCFTASFTNYKIVIDFYKPSDTAGINWKLRSGSDDSTSNYTYSGRRFISWLGASSDMFSFGTTSFTFSDWYSGASSRSATIEVINPLKPLNTQMHSITTYSSASSYYGTFLYSGQFTTNKTFDGFSFNFGDASSGTIRIYGYNDGGA